MSQSNIPSEIKEKIEAEAKRQASNDYGGMDQCIYDRTKEVLKIGYSLASKTIDENKGHISGLEFACEQWEKKCDSLENKLEELKNKNPSIQKGEDELPLFKYDIEELKYWMKRCEHLTEALQAVASKTNHIVLSYGGMIFNNPTADEIINEVTNKVDEVCNYAIEQLKNNPSDKEG